MITFCLYVIFIPTNIYLLNIESFLTSVLSMNSFGLVHYPQNISPSVTGVDFLAFPPINIGEIYKKIFDLRKVIRDFPIIGPTGDPPPPPSKWINIDQFGST